MHPKQHVEVRDEASRRYSNEPQPEVISYNSEAVNLPASIAIDLVARWGTVACVPDGEDSSGRQKLRLQTPTELVDRAMESASILCHTMRDCGWLSAMPSLAEGREILLARSAQAKRRGQDTSDSEDRRIKGAMAAAIQGSATTNGDTD